MAFLAAAAPLLGAAGAVTGAAGGLLSGIASGNAAHYQAEVAGNNALIAQQNAAYSSAAGQVAAQQKSLQGAETAARIKTAIAANGIDVNSGSAADVQQSQREQSNTDTQNTVQNADLQAYGYRTQAVNDQAQAGLDEQQADAAPIGAAIGATGSLLSNASSVGFKWSGLGFTPYSTSQTADINQVGPG